MTHPALVSLGLAALLGLGAAVRPASAEPCLSTTAACTEWVRPGPGPERSLVYRTYSLEARNERITRALVMVHGAGRNADGYFRTAAAAAFLAGALEDTLVVAPRFAAHDGQACMDSLAPDEISWPCTGVSWRAGGAAPAAGGLTAFDLGDEILRRLARRDRFPALRAIVVAGHSAGGQWVSRYAMATRVHDALGVPVTYVVSNPSSYAYPDANRPGPDGATRAYADARNCTTYDHWPYGLQHRAGYAAPIPDDRLRTQLAERPVTYLLGGLDTLPLANFDGSCPAMAQGPHRLARGQAFVAHVNAAYGARHALTLVPLCGHNARCMFTADAALRILFPKP